MATQKQVVTVRSRGRMYASQQGNDIRLAYRQGKRGVWRKFMLNFAAQDAALRCQSLGTTASEKDASDWAMESEFERRFANMG